MRHHPCGVSQLEDAKEMASIGWVAWVHQQGWLAPARTWEPKLGPGCWEKSAKLGCAGPIEHLHDVIRAALRGCRLGHRAAPRWSLPAQGRQQSLRLGRRLHWQLAVRPRGLVLQLGSQAEILAAGMYAHSSQGQAWAGTAVAVGVETCRDIMSRGTGWIST